MRQPGTFDDGSIQLSLSLAHCIGSIVSPYFSVSFTLNSIEIPATDYWRLRSFDRGHDSAFNNMFQAFHRYGFDGGMSGGMGETIYMSISQRVFTNHACDHKPNLQGLVEYMPNTEEFWKTLNPVADRLRGEINHITIAARDISKGEMITDDYTRWDGLMHSKQDKWGHPQITEWCGKDSKK
jgi:hypothetical protein